MQVGARARGKRLKEILEQLDRQVADADIPPRRLGEPRRIEHKVRAPAQVDRRQRQAFVHGHDKVAGAVDSLFVAERLPHGLPEHDADVFDRMMLVDVQVAARFEFEVEGAVPVEAGAVVLAAEVLSGLIGVVALRITRPHISRPYRVWLYPAPPIIFAAITIWMMIYLLRSKTTESVAGLGTAIAGLLLYFCAGKRISARQ